jgi:hypothetical protein
MHAKVINGVVVTFPYTLYDASREYPNVSFPRDISVIPEDTLNIHNIFSVTQKADPSYDPVTQYLVQGSPVFVNGLLGVTRVVTNKSPEQIAKEASDKASDEDRVAMKADQQVINLLKARPTAINNYIENNVTNLAQAKEVLKVLARALAVVAHSQFD